jgi:hypothetical protein
VIFVDWKLSWEISAFVAIKNFFRCIINLIQVENPPMKKINSIRLQNGTKYGSEKNAILISSLKPITKKEKKIIDDFKKQHPKAKMCVVVWGEEIKVNSKNYHLQTTGSFEKIGDDFFDSIKEKLVLSFKSETSTYFVNKSKTTLYRISDH